MKFLPLHLVLGGARGLVEFGQGLADVVVRQAVDVGVEPWGHNQADHGHQLVEVEGADGVRLGVHEDGGGVEDGHQRQVGSTGGEGLVAAGPSWNAQHCGRDVGIGDHGHCRKVASTARAATKSSISTVMVPEQQRRSRGEMSQKKWLRTLGPQSLRQEVRAMDTKETRKPPSQELRARLSRASSP